jgi:hypothetical protein
MNTTSAKYEIPDHEYVYGVVPVRTLVAFLASLVGLAIFPFILVQRIEDGEGFRALKAYIILILLLFAVILFFIRILKSPRGKERQNIRIYPDHVVLPDYTQRPFKLNTVPLSDIRLVTTDEKRWGGTETVVVRTHAGGYCILYPEYFRKRADVGEFIHNIRQLIP